MSSRSLFDLSGRVAVVTGAASGLGEAIAVGLAQAGADVAVADLNLPGAQATAAQIEAAGRRALALRCDVQREDDIERLFAEVDRVFGRLDILVNDVGVPSH